MQISHVIFRRRIAALWASATPVRSSAASRASPAPAVYPFRYMATGGGLLSYGPDFVAQYRPSVDYVDRILKGEKSADLVRS